MWLAQFVCAPQFFKTPTGLCGHTVMKHGSTYVDTLIANNNRIWSAENPHTFHERPLHSLKVGVWFAVSQRRITGPIFFSEMITAERYQELIMNFISLLKFTNKTAGFSNMGLWCIQQIQQCRCWASSLVVALFLKTCGLLNARSIITRFLSLGVLKENVYKNNLHTL
jgi:hypothetical protein